MIVTSPNVITHTQEVAATIWEVEHNSPVVPQVAVAIEINGVFETILPRSIKHEANKVLIEFSKPRTGKATLG